VASARLRRTVHERHTKGDDLELHVSIVTVGDESYVDIRDFVPSTKTYGRGSVIPVEWANEVALDIIAILEARDGANTS
jgi:hypothetical protein